MIEEVKAGYGKKEEEMNAEKAELQAELSKAAAQPLKHNPEGSTQAREMVRFASNAKNTVLNRILNKINN